MKFLWSWAFC